jgi:Fur family transcriptional regulator, ferric uptake regulator
MKDEIIQILKKSRLKITSIRIKLISIFKVSGSPLTVSDLLSKIKANKTTIYREINVLLKSNLLIEVDFADGIKRYELSSLNHHHHLICLKCRQVQDITINENLSEEEVKISKIKNFKVLKHNLEFFGYCQNCL